MRLPALMPAGAEWLIFGIVKQHDFAVERTKGEGDFAGGVGNGDALEVGDGVLIGAVIESVGIGGDEVVLIIVDFGSAIIGVPEERGGVQFGEVDDFGSGGEAGKIGHDVHSSD